MATTPPPPSQALKSEFLPLVDTTRLSQSELQALSLCSLSAFDLSATANLVFPEIDRSLFNESAGSRRQTYSRPRPRQPLDSSPSGLRRRLPGLLPLPKPPPNDTAENRHIINTLKHFIRQDPKFHQIELVEPVIRETLEGIVGKRKRGRKPKVKEDVNNVVDVSGLEGEDPFGEELRRRSEGLEGEEGLLGFLRELEGQWGSRRRKRKIVDAADFGHVLPVGWKLLLGLKRKDGRAWIYCRRYISPSGEQFVSWKEVSSYLQSRFGHIDTRSPINFGVENMLIDNGVTTQSFAGVTHEEQDQRMIVANESAPPSPSECNERLKDVALLGIENLADVQVHDLFECHKCNLTFDEKDSYLQHLLSVHQRTTRRYRVGSSVGDGVIIKDGKYVCQFCHKVFLERRRYNGHVGIHVRNYVKKAEESPGQLTDQMRENSPIKEDFSSRISKMDALIEIAQNSIMENSAIEPFGGHASSPDRPNAVSTAEDAVGNLHFDKIIESPLNDEEMEDNVNHKYLGHNLEHQGSKLAVADGDFEKTDGNEIIDSKMETFEVFIGLSTVEEKNENSRIKDDAPIAFDLDGPSVDLEGVSQSPLLSSSGNGINPEVENNQNSGGTITVELLNPNEDSRTYIENEIKFDLDGAKDVSVMSEIQETTLPNSKENSLSSEVPTLSMSMAQSLECFFHLTGLSDKDEIQYFSDDHNHDNEDVNGSQELRFDETEASKCDFANGQPSHSLSEVPKALANIDTQMEEGVCASSVQVESQEAGKHHHITTSCVWCGIEFDYDAVDSEIQPDSVGFMCPACKAKISGQIDVLDCGSPLNSGHI